jgi:nitrite reductase (NADH) large subunit
MKQYLIVGNGVAGTTAAQEIRKMDSDGNITIVTEESLPFYSRIKLPEYIAGAVDSSDLVVRKEQWYEERQINLKTGARISDIDHNKCQAFDESGNGYPYDALLLSMGSHPFIPPVNGSGLKNVFALRTFENANNIISAAETSKNCLVIGGGLLGLEAAHALIRRGLPVTVVEHAGRLLPRQMDPEGGALLKEMLEKLGFVFKSNAKTKQVLGEQAITGLELESGEVLETDMLLFSTGVRSNLDLPGKLGLEVDRSVVVNSRMESSIAGIYAAGDVAQFQGANFCIWPEAQEQGRIAGINMAGGEEDFKTIVPSNRLKVAGIDLASAGNIDSEGELESEIEKTDKVYKKLVKKDGKPVGCIMLGNTEGFLSVVKQISGK